MISADDEQIENMCLGSSSELAKGGSCESGSRRHVADQRDHGKRLEIEPERPRGRLADADERRQHRWARPVYGGPRELGRVGPPAPTGATPRPRRRRITLRTPPKDLDR